MPNSNGPGSPPGGLRHGTPRGTQLTIAVIVLLCLAAFLILTVQARVGPEVKATPTISIPTKATDVSCDTPPNPPAQPKQFLQAPSPTLAQDKTWQAIVRTTCGDFVVELYGDKAPQTIASFISLARADYWVDSPCQRLTTAGIYVLQCGDPTGTGSGTPGYGFGIENAPPNGVYPRGTLAMARTSDPHSNGGQFFVVYKNTRLPTSGGGYSIFGRVIKGLAVVDAVARQGVAGGGTDGQPVQPISILSVQVGRG